MDRSAPAVWFYCVKNRIWNRRLCKHSACQKRAITRVSVGPPQGDNPE